MGPQSPWKVWMVWDCGILALTQCSAEEWHGRSTEAPRYSLCSRIGKAVERATRKKKQPGRTSCLSGGRDLVVRNSCIVKA